MCAAVVRNVLPLSHVASPRLSRTPCSQTHTHTYSAKLKLNYLRPIDWDLFARALYLSVGLTRHICLYCSTETHSMLIFTIVDFGLCLLLAVCNKPKIISEFLKWHIHTKIMQKCVRESHLGPMLFWTSLTFIVQKKKMVRLEEEKAHKAFLVFKYCRIIACSYMCSYSTCLCFDSV